MKISIQSDIFEIMVISINNIFDSIKYRKVQSTVSLQTNLFKEIHPPSTRSYYEMGKDIRKQFE